MTPLKTALAVTALVSSVALTGCSDDKDKNKEKESASAALSQAASQLSSQPSGSGLSDIQKQAAAAAGASKSCQLTVNGKQITGHALGMSCDDATAIWNKFPDKDKQIGNGKVDYNGTTYQCTVANTGSEPFGGCLAGQGSSLKGLTFSQKAEGQ